MFFQDRIALFRRCHHLFVHGKLPATYNRIGSFSTIQEEWNRRRTRNIAIAFDGSFVV